MPSASTIQMLTQLSYLIAAALFILGLKRMSSPVTAVSGVRWAGMGMVLATVVTLAFMGASSLNLILVIAAIAIGTVIAWVSGKRVAMTDMPQMIALYNGTLMALVIAPPGDRHRRGGVRPRPLPCHRGTGLSTRSLTGSAYLHTSAPQGVERRHGGSDACHIKK